MHKRERIADFGEVVYRAVVNVSPDRCIYVIFGPNRPIRETDLATHRHLAAGLTHLPHCSCYAVCVFEIKGRKARGKWRNLTAGIEGREHLGCDRLYVDLRIHLTAGHYDILHADWEAFSSFQELSIQFFRMCYPGQARQRLELSLTLSGRQRREPSLTLSGS